MSDKETIIGFRTSKALKKQLAELAKKDKRSLSGQIEFLLEKALKSLEDRKG